MLIHDFLTSNFIVALTEVLKHGTLLLTHAFCRILAEGAIALPVTLSGGVLFAS